MMGYGIWMALSSFMSAIFGGGAVYLFTLRSKKKEAAAQAHNAEAMAEGSDLNNANKMLDMWEKTANYLEKQLEEQRSKSDEMSVQIEALRKEIASLSRTNARIVNTNNRIITLLDNLNHDNLEEMVQKIKEKIKSDSL